METMVAFNAMATKKLLAPSTSLRPSPRVPSLVEVFLSGRNERTLQAYARDLEDFRIFLGGRNVEAAAREVLSHGLGEANALVLRYRTDMLERALAPSTVNRRLSALRSLVTLARTVGMVSWKLEVPNVKAQAYRDTRGPGTVGVHRLFSELRREGTPRAVRDLALFRLLYDLALRRNEAVSLDLVDVDLEAGIVRIQGKGRTEKEPLSLPAETQKALRAWLRLRGRSEGPLFVNLNRATRGRGARLTGRSVDRNIKAWGLKVGLRLNPHGLRHSAITEALELTNGNVRAVQRFSRHMDVRVLGAYDDNRSDLGGKIARLVASGAKTPGRER